MELIQSSEMSANYNLMPGKYPKEHIRYSNHGENLKSRRSSIFLTSAPDGGWVVHAMPQLLYPQERPGTHHIGGGVGPRAGLDRCRKSSPTTAL